MENVTAFDQNRISLNKARLESNIQTYLGAKKKSSAQSAAQSRDISPSLDTPDSSYLNTSAYQQSMLQRSSQLTQESFVNQNYTDNRSNLNLARMQESETSAYQQAFSRKSPEEQVILQQLKKLKKAIKNLQLKLFLLKTDERTVIVMVTSIISDIFDSTFVIGILVKVILLYLTWKKGTVGNRIIARIILAFDCIPIINYLPLSAISAAYLAAAERRKIRSSERKLRKAKKEYKKLLTRLNRILWGKKYTHQQRSFRQPAQ